MVDRKNTVLGVEYSLKAPENIAEAVEICGGDENLLVEHFVQKLVYNHHNAEVRALFVEKVEEQTGIKRKTVQKDTGKKNEDGSSKMIEVYDETETEYFNRVLAESGTEAGDYVAELQAIADANPLDGKKKARTSAGPKLAKMYVQGATEIVNAGSGEKAAKVLSAELGMPIEATIESIARGLKEREDRRRAEFAQSLKGLV